MAVILIEKLIVSFNLKYNKLINNYIFLIAFFDKSGVYNGEEIPDVSNLESSGWQCVFCSRGPHVRDIGYDPTGDLFGPYYVSIPKVAKTIDNPKRKVY